MAFSFLKCLGYDIGNSLVEKEKLPEVKKFLDSNHAFFSKIFFPEDLLIGHCLDTKDKPKCVSIKEGIPKDCMGLDIGPSTLNTWSKELQGGATYFWNGPVGVFENPLFCHGTFSLAQIISDEPGIKIVGGGDSVSAINQLNLAHKFSHLSTGGGASLELIEFGHLPGIDALSNK
jgi:phosphoglycerate kinase